MLRSLREKKGRFDFRRRYMPRRIASQAEFDKLADLGVIDCLEPVAPFISKTSPIVTAGSCFAENIAVHLNDAGYNIQFFNVADRLFTPPALLAFIQRALRDQEPASILTEYWPDIVQAEIDQARRRIEEGGIFIATFGLSVVWANRTTGEMIFDPTRHTHLRGHLVPDPATYEMIQMSVDDILECMIEIINALRTINSKTKVIFTLSPNTLTYSGTDYPVVVADCISKSYLRVALDQVIRAQLKDVYYYPSFELLRWLAPMADTVWGGDKNITHITRPWIDYALRKFRQYYCVEREPPPLPPAITTPPF